MLLNVAIFIGVAVTLLLLEISRKLGVISQQIVGINQQLESNQATMKDLKGEFQVITKELKWYEDNSFAKELREWIQEVPKGITGELQATTSEIMGVLSSIEINTAHD